MSAFQVSTAHINALITAALKYDRYERLPCPEWANLAERFPSVFGHAARRVGLRGDLARFPQDYARALLVANLDSVNHRYPQHGTEGDDILLLAQVYTPQALDVVSLIKQTHCYAYQACERDDWDSSWARAFCTELEHILVLNLPGYEAAPWGV